MICIPIQEKDSDRPGIMLFITPAMIERFQAGQRLEVRSSSVAAAFGVQFIAVRFSRDDAHSARMAGQLAPELDMRFEIIERDHTKGGGA